jgi:hypothetical protein
MFSRIEDGTVKAARKMPRSGSQTLSHEKNGGELSE